MVGIREHYSAKNSSQKHEPEMRASGIATTTSTEMAFAQLRSTGTQKGHGNSTGVECTFMKHIDGFEQYQNKKKVKCDGLVVDGKKHVGAKCMRLRMKMGKDKYIATQGCDGDDIMPEGQCKMYGLNGMGNPKKCCTYQGDMQIICSTTDFDTSTLKTENWKACTSACVMDSYLEDVYKYRKSQRTSSSTPTSPASKSSYNGPLSTPASASGKACPKVSCDKTCEHGYVKDKNNCEICECKAIKSDATIHNPLIMLLSVIWATVMWFAFAF